MNLSLKDAKILKSRYEKELDRLCAKRKSTAFVQIAPNEDYHDYIDTDVDSLSISVLEYISAIIKLDNSIREAVSASNAIEIDDMSLSLAAAKHLAAAFRREIDTYKDFASKTKKWRQNSYGDNSNLVTVVTYDIQKYNKQAKELEKKCEALSSAIDSAESSITVDVQLTI